MFLQSKREGWHRGLTTTGRPTRSEKLPPLLLPSHSQPGLSDGDTRHRHLMPRVCGCACVQGEATSSFPSFRFFVVYFLSLPLLLFVIVLLQVTASLAALGSDFQPPGDVHRHSYTLTGHVQRFGEAPIPFPSPFCLNFHSFISPTALA